MFKCMMKLNGKKVILIGDINYDRRKVSDLQYKKLDINMKLFGMVVTEKSYIEMVYGQHALIK